MTLIEVLLLAGVQCLSPVESAEKTTTAGKVPCAVLVRLDQETGDVDFSPPSAATNPEVIAMLVNLPAGEGEPSPPPALAETPAKPEPRRSVERRKGAAVVKAQRTARRRDVCGSYRAVWYTNKQGHKRYRCVRNG